MSKNVYQMLNDINVNLDDYDTTLLTELEAKRYKKQILSNLAAREAHSSRKKSNWKRALAGGAAACMGLMLIGALANPVAAKNFLSKGLSLLFDNAEGSKYQEEDQTLYTQMGKNSSTGESAGQMAGDVYQVTDEGVTVEVSDIYCDGYYLYYTLQMETENEGLLKGDGIVMCDKSDNVSKIPMITLNDSQEQPMNLNFQRGEDGTFAALGEVNLLRYRTNPEIQVDVPEEGTFQMGIHLNYFRSIDYDLHDEDGEYSSLGEVEGDWSLSFPVTIDTSQNVTKTMEQEENGVELSRIVRTGTHVIVEFAMPDMTKAPYNDPYNDPAVLVYRADGAPLPMSEGITLPNEDGTSTWYMTFMYTEDTDLRVEVVNKNVDGSVIASFDVEGEALQFQNENKEDFSQEEGELPS